MLPRPNFYITIKMKNPWYPFDRHLKISDCSLNEAESIHKNGAIITIPRTAKMTVRVVFTRTLLVDKVFMVSPPLELILPLLLSLPLDQCDNENNNKQHPRYCCRITNLIILECLNVNVV